MLRLASFQCVTMALGIPNILSLDHFQQFADLWTLVPLPKGPQATEHITPIYNKWMGVIPSHEPDPQAIIELRGAMLKYIQPYHDMTSEEYEKFYWNTWANKLPDRLSLEVWQFAARNMMDTPLLPIVQRNGYNTAFTQIIVEGINPATALAQVAPQVQAALDEMFNK